MFLARARQLKRIDIERSAPSDCRRPAPDLGPVRASLAPGIPERFYCKFCGPACGLPSRQMAVSVR